MPGQRPSERTYINVPDSNERIELFASWKQEKGQLTGKITVTEEIAVLFKPGEVLRVVTFPDRPRSSSKPSPERKPAA